MARKNIIIDYYVRDNVRKLCFLSAETAPVMAGAWPGPWLLQLGQRSRENKKLMPSLRRTSLAIDFLRLAQANYSWGRWRRRANGRHNMEMYFPLEQRQMMTKLVLEKPRNEMNSLVIHKSCHLVTWDAPPLRRVFRRPLPFAISGHNSSVRNIKSNILAKCIKLMCSVQSSDGWEGKRRGYAA